MNEPQSSAALCDKCNKFSPQTYPPLSPQVIRSDYVPSAQEILETHTSIRKEEAQLQRFDEEIERLHGIIDELREQRDLVQQRLDARCSSLSIVRRVPSEIWNQIFTVFCTDPEGFTSSSDDGFRVSPFILSLVCSRWRSIVDHAPLLWSSISINFCQQPDIRGILETHLKKSRDHPMRLRLFGNSIFSLKGAGRETASSSRTAAWDMMDYTYAGRPWLSYAKLICRFILEHCTAQCGELDLRLGHNFEQIIGESTSHIGQVSFPNLTSLKLGASFGLSTYETQLFWRGIRTAAPKLTEVASTSLPDADMLPYKQLTKLDLSLEGLGVRDLLRVLSECDSLEHLSIAGLTIQPQDMQPSPVATTILPRLQYAYVSSELLHSQSIPLLSSLIVPIMTTLHVATVVYPRVGWRDWQEPEWLNASQNPDGHGFFEPLCKMLKYSTFLTTLSLHILHMTISEHISFAEVLKFVPNLTFLSVAAKARRSEWGARPAQPSQLAVLFELLSSMASLVPVLVPRLVTFELTIYFLSSPVALEVADHAIQMAEQRSSTITPQATLTTVRLTFRELEYETPWVALPDGVLGKTGWDLRRARCIIFSEQSLLHRLEALEQRGTKFTIAELKDSNDHSPTDSWCQ